MQFAGNYKNKQQDYWSRYIYLFIRGDNNFK